MDVRREELHGADTRSDHRGREKQREQCCRRPNPALSLSYIAAARHLDAAEDRIGSDRPEEEVRHLEVSGQYDQSNDHRDTGERHRRASHDGRLGHPEHERREGGHKDLPVLAGIHQRDHEGSQQVGEAGQEGRRPRAPE